MSLAVTVGGLAIDEFCDLSVDRALEYVSNTALELDVYKRQGIYTTM